MARHRGWRAFSVSQEFVPHGNQLEAMDHLFERKRAGLWMPMGGGKTVTTLTALHHLDPVERVYPALVLAPKRVARKVWSDEVAKWSHLSSLPISNIVGDGDVRRMALRKDAAVYTINYENLPWLIDNMGSFWRWPTLIADEWTKLKGYRTRQGSKRAGMLRPYAHKDIERFIGLTGTPSPNGLIDLWGQLWFVDGGARLGKSYQAFEDRWFKKGYDGFSMKPLDHSETEIHHLVRDVCVTIKGLPVDKPTEHTVWVDLPANARRVYKEMEKEMFSQLTAEKGIEAFSAAAKSIKCHQLANGFMYDEEGLAHAVHREKIEALESIISEANGANILVAYTFKHDLEMLKKAFPQGRELKTTKDEDDWNAGKIGLLFAHPASCGHGLNLQFGGHHLVYYSIDWNLETHQQILERIGPMRQLQAGLNRPVFVYYILARGTIDVLIESVLEGKGSTQDVLLEAARRHKEAA